MRRPDTRPMRQLPLLEAKRQSLETCVFCPKLCRTACPVSNAEPRETLTPWGKMSAAYLIAHGDAPVDRAHAAPAWACTGCFACREACDHRNEVAPTLVLARGALAAAGAAPVEATRALGRFPEHQEHTRQAVRELCAHRAVHAGAPDALLIGCTYVRGAMEDARHAIDAASALVRGPVALVEACCGLPLLYAGARGAFERQATQFARETARAERILVADAGCARTLRVLYPAYGIHLQAPVELLVERAFAQIDELSAVPTEDEGPVRWHDPCQLGRGLGIYEAPRAILTRALGRPPEEFIAHGAHAACSGGGGLLPATMPDVARAIADARLDDHEEAGGGRIVTACAGSLLSLRRRAGRRGAAVDDIVTWIARAARPWRAPG